MRASTQKYTHTHARTHTEQQQQNRERETRRPTQSNNTLTLLSTTATDSRAFAPPRGALPSSTRAWASPAAPPRAAGLPNSAAPTPRHTGRGRAERWHRRIRALLRCTGGNNFTALPPPLPPLVAASTADDATDDAAASVPSRRWYWSMFLRVRRAVPSPRSRALVSRRGAPLRPTPATRRHEHLLHSARRRSAWPRCPLPLLPRARPSHRRPVNQRPPKTSPLTPWPAPCRSARSPKRTKRVGGASGPRPCRREPHTTKTGRPAKSATELRHQTRHIEPGEVPEGPKPLGARRGTLSTAPVSRARLQLDGANLLEVARRAQRVFVRRVIRYAAPRSTRGAISGGRPPDYGGWARHSAGGVAAQHYSRDTATLAPRGRARSAAVGHAVAVVREDAVRGGRCSHEKIAKSRRRGIGHGGFMVLWGGK